MNKVILTRGLPASGKTTWAKELVLKEPGKWKRINKDDLRSMLDAGKWSRDNEKKILDVRNTLAICIVDVWKQNVIIDDTNLDPKHEKSIRDDFELHGVPVEIEIKDFTDVPLQTCIERDAKREKSVGEKVIRDMYRRYLSPKAPEDKPELKNIVICDIDGTLALHNGRSPYDVDKCDTDIVNPLVYGFLRDCHLQGLDYILVSGRESKFRRKTCDWLFSNTTLIPLAIFMRPTGDKRPDNIVKKEIYEQEIKGKYNVKLVLDDRNRVVDMWRGEGLTVWQVAEGNF